MQATDWRKIWESKETEPEFAASGRSSGDAAQLFALLADVCAALEPEPVDRVLDLGCGVGLLARHLAPYVGTLVGLDFALSLLRRAADSTPRAGFVAGDLLAMPFHDGSFTKVLVSSVLQYLDGDEAVARALREIRRVVVRGGRAFASGNPDRRLKEDYIAGIERLDLPEERKVVLRERNRSAFWLSPETLAAQAEDAGWTAEIRQPSPTVWQSFYMFDVLLIAR